MPAYREFFRLGWKIVVVDHLQNQSLRFADDIIIHDLKNINELCNIILNRVGKPDGILTFNDSALVQTAKLAEMLDLNFLKSDIAEIATNKLMQKKVFTFENLPTPKWVEINSPDQAIKPLEDWNCMVVKPIDRSASAGVGKIENVGDIDSAYENAINESVIGRVLIEEYINGPELSVETIFINGEHKVVSITDKITTEGNTFVELGHSTPSGHSKEILEKVKELAIKACTALNINYGACHTEIKLTEKEPMIIEVNPRLAGDCIVDLIDLSLGINLYRFYGKLAVNETITLEEITPKFQKGAAIKFKPSKYNEILVSVDSTMIDYPTWLEDLSVIQELNVPMPNTDSNAGRIAYAIATGNNGKDALKNADSALSSISFSYKEES
jgi:biotin carboxylase